MAGRAGSLPVPTHLGVPEQCLAELERGRVSVGGVENRAAGRLRGCHGCERGKTSTAPAASIGESNRRTGAQSEAENGSAEDRHAQT